jgi:hypothetical protein
MAMRYARKSKKTNILPLILEIALIVAIVAGCVLLFVKYMSGEDTPTDPVLPGQTAGQVTTVPPETTVPPTTVDTSPEAVIRAFAADNGLTFWDYPVKVVQMLERNPETVDFVLSYPLKYNTVEENIDMSEYEDDEGVPLFMQWDTRWGYRIYGNNYMAINGCGPTALSIVYTGLTGKTDVSPYDVSVYAIERDMYVPSVGTKWNMMLYGGIDYGLKVEELVEDFEKARAAIEAGKVLVCKVGPGDFTTGGHFIVLTEIDADGMVTVRDPNSMDRSMRKWDFDRIMEQTDFVWSYTTK